MKELPVGIQDFREIIEKNLLYVDKTKEIFSLLKKGSYYFFSRPRRFGKSLLLSTLKELFLGNKELFKGLWIYNKIDWKPRAVIHISFIKFSNEKQNLRQYIHNQLDNIAEEYQVALPKKDTTLGRRFELLIRALAKKERVVILIDEYDKPVIDYIDEPDIAAANRNILRDFYSEIKGAAGLTHFVFLTGIVRLRQIGIFTTLNNLDDITTDRNHASLVGITQEELLTHFIPYLEKSKVALQLSEDELLQKIRFWYNGYSWDGKTFVYNPFSLLKFFKQGTFSNYWFSTGTPTFLIKAIREQHFPLLELENMELSESDLDNFSLEHVIVQALLFQTGYLTIKEKDPLYKEYVVNYPNEEVRLSLSNNLLQEYTHNNQASLSIHALRRALEKGRVEQFIRALQALFASIPYQLLKHALSNPRQRDATAWEAHYHLVVYLTLRSLGVNIKCELSINKGRIDAVIETRKYIYITEFKVGEAQKAMEQIKEQQYHLPYLDKEKEVILLGIGFNNEERNVQDWAMEKANN